MTCAKTRVRVTLMHPDGRTWTGENYCRNPQPVCPRLPGEDYTKCRTVCDQVGHAELVALELAGKHAAGCSAQVEGHTYYCMECQHALFAAGVVGLRAPDRRKAQVYNAIADQRPEWVACTCRDGYGHPPCPVHAGVSLDDAIKAMPRYTTPLMDEPPSRCRIAGEAMNPNERTSTNPDGVSLVDDAPNGPQSPLEQKEGPA